MKHARFSEVAAIIGADNCAIHDLPGKDAAIENRQFSLEFLAVSLPAYDADDFIVDE